LETVRVPLELKAKVIAKDEGGRTPLHGAAASGHIEIVKMLTDKEANVLAQDAEKGTPLQYAEVSGYETVVKFLRMKAKNKRYQRYKATTALVVDPVQPLQRLGLRWLPMQLPWGDLLPMLV
jgi:ankyrin repeat protein